MADALKLANDRLSRAATRLREANEELAAAEVEHRVAGEWVDAVEKADRSLAALAAAQSPTPSHMSQQITARVDRG